MIKTSLTYMKALLLSYMILIQFNTFKAYSQDKTIGKIDFIGNNKTADDVLKAATDLEAGDIFSEMIFEKSIQNLKNTTVFRKVTGDFKEDPNDPNKINITYQLEEKWTIIPYFIAASGGGSTFYSLGIFDTNFLGRLYITYFQIKVQNGEPNLSTQFINNYTFGKPLVTGISAEYQNKVQTFYSRDNNELGKLTYRMASINPYFMWKFHSHFLLGGGILFQKSLEINNNIANDESILNQQNNIKTPNKFQTTAVQFRVQVGRINYDGIAKEGVLLSSISNSTLGIYQNTPNTDNYNDASLILLWFYKFHSLKSSYTATRFVVSGTDSNNSIRQYYLGGLDTLRGFHDSQFNGKFITYSNMEFRHTLWEGNIFAFQIVPFIDIAVVGNNLSDAFKQKLISSIGIGARIPLVKINGIDVRIDYAKTMTPFHTDGLSFGLTQFF